MSAETAASGTIARSNITYFPVIPGRLEFAARVRRYLLTFQPRVVAVELPASLESAFDKAIAHMPEMSAIVIADDQEEESATYIPIEPGDPFVEALRTAQEIGAQTIFLEPATHHKPHLGDLYPDSYTADVIGAERFLEAYRVHTHPRTPELEAHAAAMAWKLQGANPAVPVCAVVAFNLLDPLLDAMEMPAEEPARPRGRLFEKPHLFHLHPDCLAEVTSELPYYQEIYERLRVEKTMTLDRPRWQNQLLREAEAEYAIQTGDRVSSSQRLALAKFTRNLALLDSRLLPGLYDLALGARSIVDDNYAYEVWQLANRFAVQRTEAPPLETVNLSGEQVWLQTRKLRIRRRLPRMKQMMRPAGLKPRKREREPGQWARETDGYSICSYPPEDLAIENYGRFLKRYAKQMVSEERARVERFATSMLDGIDLRETLRNWHRGEIFVRENGRFSGDVGGLVLIFDEDRDGRYTYLTTWLGEHQNESDMAFYSTQPFEHLVGPGIGRAEYGGLLMTLPPHRLYDVWQDPDYELAESKAERLLMAGLDYSLERHVVYIAAKPPRTFLRQYAARVNRKIVYVPLGQLSPAKLKTVRVVHVLDSHERRNDARQYVW